MSKNTKTQEERELEKALGFEEEPSAGVAEKAEEAPSESSLKAASASATGEQDTEEVNKTADSVNKVPEELNKPADSVNAAPDPRTLEHMWSNALYKALEGQPEPKVKDVLYAFVPLLGIETKDAYLVADLAIDKLSAGERDGKPIHTLLSDSEIVLEAQRVAAVWLFRDLLAPVDDQVLDPAVDFTDDEVKALTDFAWKEIEEDTCRKELGLPAQAEKKGKKSKSGKAKEEKSAQKQAPAAGTPAVVVEKSPPGSTEPKKELPQHNDKIISAHFHLMEDRLLKREQIRWDWEEKAENIPNLNDSTSFKTYTKNYNEHKEAYCTASYGLNADQKVLFNALRRIQSENPTINVGKIVDECYLKTSRVDDQAPPPERKEIPGQQKIDFGGSDKPKGKGKGKGKVKDDGSVAEAAGECKTIKGEEAEKKIQEIDKPEQAQPKKSEEPTLFEATGFYKKAQEIVMELQDDEKELKGQLAKAISLASSLKKSPEEFEKLLTEKPDDSATWGLTNLMRVNKLLEQCVEASKNTPEAGAVNAQKDFDEIEALQLKLKISDADLDDIYESYGYENTKPRDEQVKIIKKVLADLQQQERNAEEKKAKADAPAEKQSHLKVIKSDKAEKTKSSKPGKTSKKK